MLWSSLRGLPSKRLRGEEFEILYCGRTEIPYLICLCARIMDAIWLGQKSGAGRIVDGAWLPLLWEKVFICIAYGWES